MPSKLKLKQLKKFQSKLVLRHNKKSAHKLLKKAVKPAAKTTISHSHFWSVQLGAFSTEAAAQSFSGQLEGIGLKKVRVSIKQNPHRFIVTVGQFDTVEQARGYKKFLEKTTSMVSSLRRDYV